MNTDKHRLKSMSEYRHEGITGEVINAAHTVHNKLGYGFLEKVYHNALVIELRRRNLFVEPQKPIRVEYDGEVVGEYFADIIIDNKVIIEVKAVQKLDSVFEAQLLNYLRATGLEVGLIINFGRSVQVKRMVL